MPSPSLETHFELSIGFLTKEDAEMMANLIIEKLGFYFMEVREVAK